MAPLLSIGLPVHNGSRHLSEAIDSLLAQDVTDLELVISDNASTDTTPDICAGYASKDERVRSVRNETNIGASANFNRVFEMSHGRYFMWGADDDVWDPRFARLCIERLERAPQAVMCGSKVELVTDAGAFVVEEGQDTEGMDVVARVHKMASRLMGSDVYAVIRPEALRKTRLFRPVYGPDTLLVLELLLMGEALCVPEVLLRRRLATIPKTPAAYVREIDPERPENRSDEQVARPLTYLAREVLATVHSSGLAPSLVTQIESDLVDTLSFENEQWRQHILDEQGWSLDDMPTRGEIRAVIRTALCLPAAIPSLAGDAAPLAPWRMRPGMRLASVRRALLRVLLPFADAQNRSDGENIYLLSRLSGQIKQLEQRVEDLEQQRRRS